MANQSETISVDEKFLRNLVAKGGKATDIASGQQITNQAEADQFLQQHVSNKKAKEPSDTTSDDDASVRRLNRRAQNLAYSDEQRAQFAEQRKQAQRRAERQRGIRATSIAIDSVSSGIRPLIDKVGSAPTVGGVGLLIAAIIFLLFVVVQINAEGDTRLKQFWYMLNGRASLVGAVSPVRDARKINRPSA
jgi:hypothetical protein